MTPAKFIKSIQERLNNSKALSLSSKIFLKILLGSKDRYENQKTVMQNANKFHENIF